MSNEEFDFHMNTALSKGMRELFIQLKERSGLNKPIQVYLAGGMAVHLYTNGRFTSDVDAEFSSRVFIPNDLLVNVKLEDGTEEELHFDTNYNSSFALMHEDHLLDAIPIDFGIHGIDIRVLSPVDLAVSKIARFSDNDKRDIESLVFHRLTHSSEIQQRAMEALGGFVGGEAMLRYNIRDAIEIAIRVEKELAHPSRIKP